MKSIELKPRRVGVGTFKATPEMHRLLREVLDSGFISYARKSKEFEEKFAAIHGCQYAILSNSGTSSLQVALQAMKEIHDWQDGDEVIVPATTFVATANIVWHNNMFPVFVDIEPDTYGIDPGLIELEITNKTRAIIPVHPFGQPCNMQDVLAVAKNHGLKIIEDSCESMLVKYKKQPVGSIGDIGCFSTYVAHLLTTGVGGLATTNNPDYAAKMRSLVNHGLEIEYLNPDDNFSPRPMGNRRFMFDSVGHSYRITEMEAALGLAQIDNLPYMIMLRGRNARHLSAGLKIINENYGNPVLIPEVQPEREHAWMMYPIVLRHENKEAMMHFLNMHEIETRDMLPILGQKVYEYLDPSDFPVSKKIMESGFYVGCHQDLSADDIQYVCQTIEKYFNNKNKVKP